ncbi:maleylpyruvate isomerase N-terminal domain-containing protein [Rugosimonospora africana]|uniref:maleylpyruvate isomerase N-terminal domain-containing protein n=1 Tax=Rugosimonospora africana TaxID=556532 RepID=UPI003570E479
MQTSRKRRISRCSATKWAGPHRNPDRAVPGEPSMRGRESARVAAAHVRVTEAMGDAAASLRCWTMWPSDRSRDYWIRRQAPETVVHRIDVHVVAATHDQRRGRL